MNTAHATEPFFLLGCVRSGTTLLRDLLRQHPRLECPEETHFFRWADPFGTDRYRRNYKNSELMRKHYQMDGFNDFEFHYLLNHATSRQDLMATYGEALLKNRQNPGGRWFDKTPQNIYGVLLIEDAWPRAHYVHIHRHPLNVVASLMEGAVMPVHDLSGAINYWNEAMAIAQRLRVLAGDRLLELSYESLTDDPKAIMAQLFSFLNEDATAWQGKPKRVHREKNKYRKKLSDAEVEDVLGRTAHYREAYGYDDEP